jgi:hypothetical protein
MIGIDHLQIQLPAGFERRGEHIARLVADAIARIPHDSDLHFHSIRVDGNAVDPGLSDQSLAVWISRAVLQRIPRQKDRA